MRRNKINEVFTPRSQNVNNTMYINRENYERDLYRSVDGTMHSFLFGESGSGKSWLYKKVFKDKRINFISINAANVSRNGSLAGEIFNKCFKGKAAKVAYKETKKAGFSAVGTAEFSHEAEYKISQDDRLIQCYKSLYKLSGRKGTIIVLDNIETIFENASLMSELSDILILLDDDDYAPFKVKFLLIAVPNDVLQYFSRAKNPRSVGNRINEMPRVVGLDINQVEIFVTKGFVRSLKVSLSHLHRMEMAMYIYDVTLGVPQRMHEYCECLAYRIEENDWNYSPDLLEDADSDWLSKGLREFYSVVQSNLNSDETTDGRRNQVIYALGRISTHQIDTEIVGVVIGEYFPNCAPDSNSGIGQVLAHLAKGDKPILKKARNSSFYTFIDSRYLMCIRMMLYIEEGSEKIKKKPFRLN